MIEVNNLKYKVSFTRMPLVETRHYQHGVLTVSTAPGMECIITQEVIGRYSIPIGHAVVVKHHKDCDNQKAARKFAFKKAVNAANMPREQATALLDAFFTRKKKGVRAKAKAKVNG